MKTFDAAERELMLEKHEKRLVAVALICTLVGLFLGALIG